MPVDVVGADGDEAGTGVECVVEGGRLIRRPVVRDLDHVDGSDRQPREAPLLLRTQVAQQRDREGPADGVGADVDAQGHAGRVPPERAALLGPEDPPAERPQGALLAPLRFAHLRPRVAEDAPVALVADLGRGTDERGADPVGRGLEPADVVEVVVRQHEQGDPIDAEQGEARVEALRERPRVDQQHSPVAAEEDRVALADVAHRDPPVLGDGPGAQQRRGDSGRRRPREQRGEHGGDRSAQHGEATRARQQ